MCASLHVLWSLFYIACGAVQLVVGIFFLVALPYLRLGSNVWAGGWNVVAGVSGALVACVGPLASPGRHEALLYLAISVMAANAINLALLEVAEWHLLYNQEARDYQKEHNLTEFLLYARLSTSAASLVAIAVGFLDAQLTFCSLQHATRRRLARRRSAKPGHDHSTDSEYIIPRTRPAGPNKVRCDKLYEHYTRSWVFDVDGGSARYQQLDSYSHADKCRDAAAAAVAAAEGRSGTSRSSGTERGQTYTVAEAKAARAAMANGGPSKQVKHKDQMRDAHKHLKQQQMQQQLRQQQMDDSSPPSGTSPDSPAVDSEESRSPISATSPEPGQEGPQYSSLMTELTKAIRKKPGTADDTSSAEFCRELDEALQVIQDLDSSTGGTLVNASSATSSTAPPPPVPDWGDSDDSSSASSRTISGKARSHPRLGRAFACPVPPPVMPLDTLQRRAREQRQEEDFQVVQSDDEDVPRLECELSMSEHELDGELYRGETPSPPPPPPPPVHEQTPVRRKTVVSICADGEMVVRELNNNEIVLHQAMPPPPSPSPSPTLTVTPPSTPPTPLSPEEHQGCSVGGSVRLSGLSLLRRKNKRPAVRLSQELQDAVLQSESLVFLSHSELVERHERNRRVQREIEQRVQQQISGHTPTDSRC